MISESINVDYITNTVFSSRSYWLTKNNWKDESLFTGDAYIPGIIAPVRWTQSVKNMIADGMTDFVECGPGQVLTGLIGRIQKSM